MEAQTVAEGVEVGGWMREHCRTQGFAEDGRKRKNLGCL